MGITYGAGKKNVNRVSRETRREARARSSKNEYTRWSVGALESKKQFVFLRELVVFAVPGRALQYMGVHF
jgi:hypothetical protein